MIFASHNLRFFQSSHHKIQAHKKIVCQGWQQGYLGFCPGENKNEITRCLDILIVQNLLRLYFARPYFLLSVNDTRCLFYFEKHFNTEQYFPET